MLKSTYYFFSPSRGGTFYRVLYSLKKTENYYNILELFSVHVLLRTIVKLAATKTANKTHVMSELKFYTFDERKLVMHCNIGHFTAQVI